MTHPTASKHLIALYEELRQRQSEIGGAGYGLLVRRGLAAWMKVWTAITPSSQSAGPTLAKKKGGCLPEDEQSELIAVLASMALDRRRYVYD